MFICRLSMSSLLLLYVRQTIDIINHLFQNGRLSLTYIVLLSPTIPSIAISFHRFPSRPLLLWLTLFICATFNSSHLGFKPLPSRLPSPHTQRLSANCCNLQMFLPSEDSLCKSVFASFVIFLLARRKN